MLRQTARLFVLRLLGIGLFGLIAAATVTHQAAFAAPDQDRYGNPITASSPAATGRGAGNQPGQFDFFVLALSWSPSFCEASRERSADRRADPQCGPRPYAFVVHGLWPQREHGYPSNCQVPAPRLNRALVDSMLELMPSPRLVFHEWDRHGTCTGLTANDYFDTLRKARTALSIPASYQNLEAPLSVAPAEIADAFVKANPGLPRDAISVTCDSKRLTGVRICMAKDLGFRDCGEVARQSCRRDSVVMPPMRGERAADLH